MFHSFEKEAQEQARRHVALLVRVGKPVPDTVLREALGDEYDRAQLMLDAYFSKPAASSGD